MSEISKGDVSGASNATRVVKNPLLSASVTGLNFDDYPNKPQLLPAAPPVVHAPPPAPTPVLMAGILNREPKTLVTVGQPSRIDDTESLDEINLNSSSEDNSGHLNLFQTREGNDANANPLLEPPSLGADSLLSQAASSFTALPSVASNVFSTFSKRIYAAGAKETESSNEPQLDIQPSYLHQVPTASPLAAPAPFYAAPPPALGEATAAPIEPPKFYAPTEVPSVNSGPPPAAVAGGQNTYRFTARKKLYAPIPGLSEQSTPGGLAQEAQTQPTQIASFQTPPYPQAPIYPQAPTAAPFDISTAAPVPNYPEERKSGGGLFSLTNLVPTGVFQNIAGLVQSATGQSNEPPVPASQSQPVAGNYFDSQPATTNYFGGPNPTPPAGNYFAPPTQGGFPTAAISTASSPAPPVGNFFVPASVPPPATAESPATFQPAPKSNSVPPPPIGGTTPTPPTGSFFTSGSVPTGQEILTAPTIPGPPLIEGNLPPLSLESNANPLDNSRNLFAPISAAPPVASESSFFTPSAVPAGVPPVGNFFVPAPVAAPAVPPVDSAPIPPAGNYLPPTSVAPPPSVGGFFTPSTPAAAPQVAASSTTQPLPGPPPVATAATLPPPAAGQASYRLQKGTRLYKSPLTAQETVTAAPSYALNPIPGVGNQQSEPVVAPAAIFNPFGQATQSEGVEVPLFPAPPSTVRQADSVVAPPFENPLTTQETVTAATSYAPNPPLGVVNPLATPVVAPAAIFNPFGQAAQGESVGIPLFSAPPSTVKETEPVLAPPPLTAPPSIVQPLSQNTTFFTPPTTGTALLDFQAYKADQVPTSEATTEPVVKPIENQVAVSFFAPPQATTEETSGDTVFTNPPPIIKQEEVERETTELEASAPPLPTGAEETPLFVPVPTESVDSTALYPPLPGSAASVNPPPASGDFFGGAANLSTKTTETFFNPFTQTVTTPTIQPSGQDLVPPPIGFVEPTASNAIELQATNPPPAISPLHSFFAPTSGAPAVAEDFNFFAPPASGNQFPNLPPQQGIAPPPLSQEAPPLVPAAEGNSFTVPPALGFDQLLGQSQQAAVDQTTTSIDSSYQNSSVNSFDGYFGGSSESKSIEPPAPVATFDSATFFDQVPTAAAAAANEDQRIQNFFNNPPLQDQPAAPGELKYDIVHSGLAVKQLQERSQTPISNLVEPPSSACSELSITQRPSLTADQSGPASGEDLLLSHISELPKEILKELRMATEKNAGQAQLCPPVAIIYTPVVFHWFYKRTVDTKFVWTPFSHYDSALLETSLNNDDSTLIVPVEGGRYDVNIKERTKSPVFWEGKDIEVRRCSWFYKGSDSKYVPYTEEIAALLETEYRRAAETGEWRQKIMLTGGEHVVFHGATVMVHFVPQQNADTWGASTQSTMRPRVVKRDLDDFVIAQGESQRVDHLLFMVHGIGSACDLKMRSVEEVVEDFRSIAHQLVQSHYKNSTDMGLVGRVEVLPISWHGHLHSEELGIDEKLKSITLESIPRLRNFTNDTLLDVLFYTSPKYCQKIMNTVADSLNEVYLKYRSRHPEFNGGVSLAGHSLGSLILFDLLCHQEPLKESEEENKENPDQLPLKQTTKQIQLPSNDMLPKQVSYNMAPGGTGQPVINYTQLIFHPKKFFALGSPIGMFVTIRGIDKLGLDFRLPTCPGFYNIFHPFDPVAYRIEALVNPDMNGIRPVLIPHHKGRKRMHLELKETMTRVGADIKQRFMDTFKTTLDSVNFLATVTKVKKEAEETLEKQVNQSSTSLYPQKELEDVEESSVASTSTKARQRTDSDSTTASDPEFIELDFPLGKLNDSKRVDYVLQEAPLELINEYIFALSSHVCYWGSEDTILFVMKEIYAGLGISTDSQVPQQSMTIERPSSRNNSVSQSLLPM